MERISLKINQSEHNLYDILEIPIYSPIQVIKKSFKKLALKYHPDKTNEQTNEKFIKIKNAYDILSDSNLKNKYDDELKFINIEDVLSIEKLNNVFLNFIKSTEFDKILRLIEKKKYISNVTNLYFLLTNLSKNDTGLSNHNIFKNDIDINSMIKNLTNIEVQIDFTLEDVWNLVPKQINISRETKNSFVEQIYPLDYKQIYENEGDIVKINGKDYVGDLEVRINITGTTINGETYFVYDNELYILIKTDRIFFDRFKIIFIDGIKYIFNIKKLKNTINNLGSVYVKKNFGLPILKNDLTNNMDKTICHGNLFFIFLL